MILFPAIDLKDGHCVRLVQGDMARATTFNTDPADQARKFVADGFAWLHVVDLNGAFAGRSVNGSAVAAILSTGIERDGVCAGLNVEATLAVANAVAMPVIASGGVASIADIERVMQPDAAVLEGVIVGRALYDGRLDARAALAMTRAAG